MLLGPHTHMTPDSVLPGGCRFIFCVCARRLPPDAKAHLIQRAHQLRGVRDGELWTQEVAEVFGRVLTYLSHTPHPSGAVLVAPSH